MPSPGQQLDQLGLARDGVPAEQLGDEVLALRLRRAPGTGGPSARPTVRSRADPGQERQQAAGGVHAVVALADRPASGGRRSPRPPTSWPRWAGRQCRKSASGPASAMSASSTVKPAKAARRRRVLVLLAHRRPHVGVHHVGPLDGGRRIRVAARHRPRRARRSAPARPWARRSPAGSRPGRACPSMRGGLGQRAGHVVGVAHPGHRPPVERPELLAHREQVGQGLQRVRAVGQQVDDRHGRDGGHALDHLVARRPGRRGRRGSRPVIRATSSTDSRLSMPTSSPRV